MLCWEERGEDGVEGWEGSVADGDCEEPFGLFVSALVFPRNTVWGNAKWKSKWRGEDLPKYPVRSHGTSFPYIIQPASESQHALQTRHMHPQHLHVPFLELLPHQSSVISLFDPENNIPQQQQA